MSKLDILLWVAEIYLIIFVIYVALCCLSRWQRFRFWWKRCEMTQVATSALAATLIVWWLP